VIEVAEFTVKLVAAADPKLTAVAPVKLVPVTVIEVPPAGVPATGLTAVTVGGLAALAGATPRRDATTVATKSNKEIRATPLRDENDGAERADDRSVSSPIVIDTSVRS
jgi:ribosomal protein L3